MKGGRKGRRKRERWREGEKIVLCPQGSQLDFPWVLVTGEITESLAGSG